MAQDLVSAERRTLCERSEAVDREGCASDDYSTLRLRRTAEDAADESTKFAEFEARRAQINTDLDYLKAAAGYLASAWQSEDLDLKAIDVAAGEIRKRAKRLGSLLALPSSEPRDAIRELELATDRPQLRHSIYALSALIAKAMRSPLPTGHVLDVIGSVKARSDLDSIVELSRRITMQCELLGKSGDR